MDTPDGAIVAAPALPGARRMPSKPEMLSAGPEAFLEGFVPAAPIVRRDTRVLAYGSCFAARFAEWLAEHDYNSSLDSDSDEALVRSPLETPVAVSQQLRWAFGELDPELAIWYGRDHARVDPTEDRRRALHAAITRADLLIITLGLAETWLDTESGEPLWRRPPAELFASGRFTHGLLTTDDVVAALETIERLRQEHMPNQKVILTVSPQRPAATFLPFSPIVADVVGKSILRAGVHEFLGRHESALNDTLFYFPAFEIVRALLHDPLEDNVHVREEVGGWILDLFGRRYTDVERDPGAKPFPASERDELQIALAATERHAVELQEIADARLALLERVRDPVAPPLGRTDSEVHQQEPELELLAALVPSLSSPTLVDVGAERGGITQRLLEAGIEQAHAIEPDPDNAAWLRSRFAADTRVSVHELAAGDADCRRTLYRCRDDAGRPVEALHTLAAREPVPGLAWDDEVEIECRTIASLVAAGALPAHAGILKVDTEGFDLAVLSGLGEFDCDIVIVEHWNDLPASLGRCPWTADELVAILEPRSFRHFAALVHSQGPPLLRWDDAETPPGALANLLFFHDRVLGDALPAALAVASSLAGGFAAAEERERAVASERLGTIQELGRVAEERRQLVEELHAAAAERLEIIHELQAQLAPSRLRRLSARVRGQ